MKSIILSLIFLLSSLAFAEQQSKPNESSDLQHQQIKNNTSEKHNKHEKHHDEEYKVQQMHKNESHEDHEMHEDEHYEEHGGHESHEGHHGASKAVGKGKAIEVVDKNRGFKLSPQAFKTLEIKLKKVTSKEFKISKNTLVSSKKHKGIYRYKNGFFKFLEAKVLQANNDSYQIKVVGLHAGDQIVVNGLGLLRVADIYSTDKSEYGHGH